jgi:membrane-associated phospholipid phosphatase
VFTGRISPPHHGPFDVDISGAFQFGFMNYQIIGGWPSSHAMVMFALATCVYVLFPESRRLVIGAYLLAFFVGIGVTFGFHWLSEFIAGACFGVIVGRVVGEIYTRKEQI